MDVSDAPQTGTVTAPAMAVTLLLRRCLNCRSHASRAVLFSDEETVLCESCVRQAMSALKIRQRPTEDLLVVLDTAVDRIHER